MRVLLGFDWAKNSQSSGIPRAIKSSQQQQNKILYAEQRNKSLGS